MENKKRSPLMVIGFAILIGFLVIALLNGTIRPSSVVAAKVGLAPGTLLTADLLEVRSVPAGGVPSDAFKTIAEVEGQMLTVGRAPGDFITKAVVGESAASGIPSQLEPGHVALAVRVNSASGVAGLIRAGQTITIIGMLAPDVLQNAGLNSTLSLMPEASQPVVDPNLPAATPTPILTPTPAPLQSPLVRIAISGVKVLLVPQSFRYQELPPGSGNDQLFASATTSQSAQSGSVIVLDVPLQPVEIKPGLSVNPASLLAALDQYGKLHLAIEPAGGLQAGEILTLNLGEMYQALNAGTQILPTPTHMPNPDPQVLLPSPTPQVAP
jgi:Flp pilus assembly protein CpaB